MNALQAKPYGFKLARSPLSILEKNFFKGPLSYLPLNIMYIAVFSGGHSFLAIFLYLSQDLVWDMTIPRTHMGIRVMDHGQGHDDCFIGNTIFLGKLCSWGQGHSCCF